MKTEKTMPQQVGVWYSNPAWGWGAMAEHRRGMTGTVGLQSEARNHRGATVSGVQRRSSV